MFAAQAWVSMTRDYEGNGTTWLFAAMTFWTEHYQPLPSASSPADWLKLVKLIKAEVPGDRSIHLFCDNYGAYKHPEGQA